MTSNRRKIVDAKIRFLLLIKGLPKEDITDHDLDIEALINHDFDVDRVLDQASFELTRQEQWKRSFVYRHGEAACLANQAFGVISTGGKDSLKKADELYRQAYNHEIEALEILKQLNGEDGFDGSEFDSRFVLLENAALWAIDCGKYKEAKELARAGLKEPVNGDMPPKTIEEAVGHFKEIEKITDYWLRQQARKAQEDSGCE